MEVTRMSYNGNDVKLNNITDALDKLALNLEELGLPMAVHASLEAVTTMALNASGIIKEQEIKHHDDVVCYLDMTINAIATSRRQSLFTELANIARPNREK